MNWDDIKFRARGYRPTRDSGRYQVVIKENGKTMCYGTYDIKEAIRVSREVYLNRLITSIENYGYNVEDGVCYKNYYIVFDTGDIFSTEGSLLSPAPNNQGYYSLHINDHTEKIHRIVAECFIPNPYNKPEVNHMDTDKSNNCVANLEWCTRPENIRHAYNYGVMRTGENHSKAKLTYEDVDYIRANYIPRDPNFGTRGLARKFGVTHGTIRSILTEKNWKREYMR